jgi:hypothetical protein
VAHGLAATNLTELLAVLQGSAGANGSTANLAQVTIAPSSVLISRAFEERENPFDGCASIYGFGNRADINGVQHLVVVGGGG